MSISVSNCLYVVVSKNRQSIRNDKYSNMIVILPFHYDAQNWEMGLISLIGMVESNITYSEGIILPLQVTCRIQ